MKIQFYIYILFLLFYCAGNVWAGNPERAGQAGGTQLMVNPFARSAGLNGVNVADVRGIESMASNPAGVAHTEKTEVVFSHSRHLSSAGISINAFGLSQALGKEGTGGVLGVSFMSYNMGDINITTIDNPDGGLGTFSPTFLNIGLTYAKAMVPDRIFVGFTIKLVHEAIPDVSASGVALDGGVQYRTKGKNGKPGKFGLGVTLRNIGPEMSYSGDGLTYRAYTGTDSYNNKVSTVASTYELPSVLMIGASYRITLGDRDSSTISDHNFLPMLTFVSNSFANDQFCIGVEYSFRDILRVRGSYAIESDASDAEMSRNAFTGLAFGASLELPFGQKNDFTGRGRSTFGVDYGLRQTHFFGFTHTVGIRMNL